MTEATAGTSAPAALVRVLRPHQWVKNLLVLVPILLDHRLTEAVGGFTLWTGIAISVFLAAFVFRLHADVQGILVALMAMLSITAAVREAYAWRKADKELIKQYRFMRRIFSNARTALDRAADPAEQREILRALGEAALAEHAEWTLMHRERPLERARI